MVMEKWKFLINRLIVLMGMIGSFMGATLGYSNFLIENIGLNIFVITMTLESVGLVVVYFLNIVVIIDFIKDNKRGRN